MEIDASHKTAGVVYLNRVLNAVWLGVYLRLLIFSEVRVWQDLSI